MTKSRAVCRIGLVLVVGVQAMGGVDGEQESLREIVGEVVETHVDERIIGDNGRVDVEKLRPIMFDGCNFRYHEIGKCVGKCFSDGNKLIKK